MTATVQDDIEKKLTAARTWLIIDKPFLGALVLRLPLIEADPHWCQTTATDARGLYYNRTYIDSLTLEQTKFTLAHEALHCALSHFNRRQHRTKHRWDIACDYAVNALLVADGLTPPTGALVKDFFKDMAAEEIYPLLKDNNNENPLDQHLYDDDQPPQPSQGTQSGKGGNSPDSDDTPESTASANNDNGQSNDPGDDARKGAARPPPLTPTEGEALGTQWHQRLVSAAQQARHADKLSGAIARLVDRLIAPQLPWRTLLARYMTSVARTDYSFQRPSRREGPAILPSLHSTQIDIAVVVDTSGSINTQDLREFMGEINMIKSSINARITLHACDADLTAEGPWIYEPWEELQPQTEITGGGGTNFAPAFAWAENLDRKPDLLLYFTDAKGEFPKSVPSFPVLWLVKGKLEVPWGDRVQLN